jgi:polar amino acid transport system substrate-binding protein
MNRMTGTLAFLLVASLAVASTAAAQQSTFERVKKTGVLRVAAIVGEEPYFRKDLKTGEWSGFQIDMARDLAKELNAKLEIVESTWGNQILDLQSNKIDVAFGVNPTPKRALVIDFSRPIFYNSFGIVTRKGFEARTWKDLDKAGVKIAVDIGSSHEAIARRYAPKAQIIGFKTRDEVIMAVQSKRADCLVATVFLGMTSLKKNPELGRFTIPTPVLSASVNAGVQQEPDKTFRDFVSVWADYNRGLGVSREWILKALEPMGITAADVPAEVSF